MHVHFFRLARRTTHLYWFQCTGCSSRPVRNVSRFWPGTGAA